METNKRKEIENVEQCSSKVQDELVKFKRMTLPQRIDYWNRLMILFTPAEEATIQNDEFIKFSDIQQHSDNLGIPLKMSTSSNKSTTHPPNINEKIGLELCMMTGVYCDSYTNEYIFKYPPITECEKPEEFAIQILNDKGQFVVKKYVMPMSVNMDKLISETKFQKEKHVLEFARRCRHLVHCYFIRQEQYENLKKTTAEIKNCSIQTTLGYCLIILDLFKVYDKKHDTFHNISIHLKYRSDEVIPNKLQIDWDNELDMPVSLRHRLRVSTNIFRNCELSLVFASLMTTEEDDFLWKRKYKDDPDSVLELTSSEEDDSLVALLSKCRKPLRRRRKKSSHEKSQKRKHQEKKKPRTIVSLLRKKTDEKIPTEGEEDEANSKKTEPRLLGSEKSLILNTKPGKGRKRKQVGKIPTISGRKRRKRRSVALREHDTSSLINGPPSPISERNLSLHAETETWEMQKKQLKKSDRNISGTLQGNNVISKKTAPQLPKAFEAPDGNLKISKKQKITFQTLLQESDKSSLDLQKENKTNSKKSRKALPIAKKNALPQAAAVKKAKKPSSKIQIIVDKAGKGQGIPTNKGKVKVKQTKLNFFQQQQKNMLNPLAFAREKTPDLAVNKINFMENITTSTPLYKRQKKPELNMSDCEESSISADEDFAKPRKFMNIYAQRAKNRMEEKTDAQ